MHNIAIIPARSGSKGLVNKNIKLLDGKPLIAYTIEAAVESNLFEEIFVSTDSEEYAEIAKQYGASVPFMRSNEMATDTASSWDVVKEVLKNYETNGKVFETVALLQPTSPIRTSQDILNAYNLLITKDANAIVGVCPAEHSPALCNTLPDDLSLENFIDKEIVSLPRQLLPKYFRINGAIYISKVDYLLKSNSIYRNNCFAYVMEARRSIDIDDNIDFLLAEIIIKENKNVC